MKRITRSFSILSINFLSLKVFIDFFCYSIIGSSLVLLGFGAGYYEYSYMQNETTQKYVWLAVVYSCLFLFLTLFLLERKSKYKPVLKAIESVSSYYEGSVSSPLALFIVALLFFSFLYYLYYCMKHGYWPLLSMFTNSSAELSQIRYNDKFLSSENTIIKNFFMLTAPPISSYAAFYCYRNKRSFYWKNIFFFSIIVSILCLTYRFEKSYLIFYLLGFMLLPQARKEKSNYIHDEKRRRKLFILVGVFGLLFVLFITGGRENFNLNNMYRSFYRLFLGQIVGLYRHFELFPSKVDFLKFQFFPTTIANIFGHEEIRSARIVMMQTYGTGSSAGNMVCLFVGEAFANGGIIGLLLSPFIVGFSIFFHVFIFSLLDDNPLTRGCLVFFLLNNIPLTGGFLDFFYNPTYIILVIVSLIGSFLSTGKMRLTIKRYNLE